MLEQECAHVWLVIFAEGFDDILTTAIARFDIHASGEKPKNKLFVTELGNLENDGRTKVVLCVEIKPLRMKPRNPITIVFDRQEVQNSLTQSIAKRRQNRICE